MIFKAAPAVVAGRAPIRMDPPEDKKTAAPAAEAAAASSAATAAEENDDGYEVRAGSR